MRIMKTLFAAAAVGVTPVLADPPADSPPATTRQQCFDQYAGMLRQLYEALTTAEPPMTGDALRQALDGVIEALRVCLAALPAPETPPTRLDCFLEYMANLLNCNRRFKPLPQQVPGSAFPIYVPHPALIPCIDAAREAFRVCMESTVPPQPAATLTLNSATIAISSGQKYLFVKMKVDASEAWCPRFRFETTDMSDSALSLDAAYEDFHESDDTIEVVVPIPASLFDAKSDWAMLTVRVQDRLGTFLDGEGIPLIITWRDGDVNRDQALSADDVLEAAIRLANDEITLAQYNAIVAIIQSQP